MAATGTQAERQGAVGCGMVIAWLVTLPVVLVMYLFGYWPVSVGLLLALTFVGFWMSSRAKREPEALPRVSEADPEDTPPLP